MGYIYLYLYLPPSLFFSFSLLLLLLLRLCRIVITCLILVFLCKKEKKEKVHVLGYRYQHTYLGSITYNLLSILVCKVTYSYTIYGCTLGCAVCGCVAYMRLLD